MRKAVKYNIMEKIKIKKTVLVEGKYDKIKLESIIDGNIITTDGFSLFNNDEKIELIRKIAEKNGIIVLTDSDPAGFVLRNKLKGMLPKKNVIHLYIPTEKGKEKRKKTYSKAGLLGVEGMDAEILREMFVKYESSDLIPKKSEVTKADLYEIGLSGKDGSNEKREKAAVRLGLPKGMSANAFLEAVNMLGISREELNIEL